MTELSSYQAAFALVESTWQRLEACLGEEIDRARAALEASARDVLPGFGVFAASGSVRDRLDEAGDEGERRGWRQRARDRLFLFYLQRVCSKNDTFGDFGPTAWGRIEGAGLAIAPVPGVSRREAFLEKWVVTELAAAMTADPEARLEAAPRLHPDLALADGGATREDTGESIPLSPDLLQRLQAVDGSTPAHACGLAPGEIERLVEAGALCWEVTPFALDPRRLEHLVDETAGWREGEARRRWLGQLGEMAEIQDRFAGETDPARRHEMMDAVAGRLGELGREVKTRARALYAAANPIGEECLRECGFALGQDVADRLVRETGPWLDMFRRVIALAHARALGRVRELAMAAPRARGGLSLPALLRHAEAAGAPLAGDGIGRLAREAFGEVERAFWAAVADRPDAPEWLLDAGDCGFLARAFPDVEPGDGMWPSVDLQIAAGSVDDIAAGRYQLVIGELNTLVPIAAHTFYWGCPDPALLAGELRRMIGGGPVCHWSLEREDRATHVVFRWPDILGRAWTGVTRERLPPEHRQVRPAEVEVAIDENGDVRLRAAGQDLGSMVNPWDLSLSLGIHPFFFHRRPHLPRLRVGSAIVQRRAWTVDAGELGSARRGPAGLMLGVERLRSARDIGRYVFARPSPAQLGARHAASARDKDVKPFFVDLESALCVEA
ncbi:MAG TPA: hypothetical protein VNO33_10410, partial [Kofleriaceae bacterium]|nr:hypothetical protein [Kofleriaceae bacterium]